MVFLSLDRLSSVLSSAACDFVFQIPECDQHGEWVVVVPVFVTFLEEELQVLFVIAFFYKVDELIGNLRIIGRIAMVLKDDGDVLRRDFDFVSHWFVPFLFGEGGAALFGPLPEADVVLLVDGEH